MALSGLRTIGRAYSMFAEVDETQVAFSSFVKTRRRRVCVTRRRANEIFWLRVVVGSKKFRNSS